MGNSTISLKSVRYYCREIKPKDDWPSNFKEDPEAKGCGIYWCPNPECENSREQNIKE